MRITTVVTPVSCALPLVIAMGGCHLQERAPETILTESRIEDLCSTSVVFVLLPDVRGVSMGHAVMYGDQKLLLSGHQIRRSSGRVFVNGVEMTYVLSARVEEIAELDWALIEVDANFDLPRRFEVDFEAAIPEGEPIVVVWYEQSVDEFFFPVEYHLDDFNFTEASFTAVSTASPGRFRLDGFDETFDVDGDNVRGFVFFEPALSDGASGSPAFRWDQNASRWLLVGIVTGGMEITPHNPNVESPDPIGIIRRPHELVD